MTALIPRDKKRSRYLFDFSAQWSLEQGGSLNAITGQAATFTRAGVKYVPDAAGRYRAVPHSLGAFEYATDPVSGLVVPGLCLEGAGTNLVVQSDALATGWTLTGTVAATNAYANYAGRPFSRVSNTTGGNILRAVTFTGNGTKALSFLVRQDAAASGNASFLLVDSTASVTRGRVTVTIAANGSISAVGSGGATILRTQSLADSVYRIYVQAASIVAANTNQVYVAEGATATAASYLVSGVQAEDAAAPSSLMPTTTATVTRAADALSFACGILPRTLTMYAKIVDLGTSLVAASAGIVDLGGNGATPRLILYNASQWIVNHSAGSIAGVANTDVLGNTVELRGLLNSGGSVNVGASINGATETTGTDLTAPGLEAAWNTPNLYFNRYDVGTNGFASFQKVRIAAGVQSLSYMREG